MMPIKAIAAFTQSGNTALFMSRHVSAVPIYALTPEPNTLGRVALFRNVTPRALPDNYTEATDAPRATTEVLAMMHKDGLVNKGDMIVMTMGTPMGRAGSTNTMKMVRVD